MGSIRKKNATKKLPKEARITDTKDKRIARWTDSNGKTRNAPVIDGRDGSLRIVITSRIYLAKYRDEHGRIVEVSTGCKDRQAAMNVLRELENQAEKMRAGIFTETEGRVSEHQAIRLSKHIKRYMTKLESESTSGDHRSNVFRCLKRIAAHCKFMTLVDLRRDSFEEYLVHRKNEGDSARTRNLDRASLVAFSNWCVETHRLISNPFEKVAKANEDVDRRHERRAMTVEEIHKLLDATRRRPLLEAMTIRTGKNKGQLRANIRDEVHADRIRLGNERALIYSALVYTGLRKGELQSLTIAHVVLDTEPAYLILKAKDEKAKRGATLPLHPALVEAIKTSLADREELNGRPLPLSTPLFNVPSALSKIFNRDIVLAGIEKRDALDRVVDVHCLRHSHASLLAKAGVAPAVTQKSMRHSDVKLTMEVYTHTALSEIAEAVSRLPDLAVRSNEPKDVGNTERAKSGNQDSEFPPMFPPKTVQCGQNGATPDNLSEDGDEKNGESSLAVKSCHDKSKGSLTTGVNDPSGVGDTGLE